MLDAENQFKASRIKFTEALELLNEAAKEKKDELKGLFTDKYSHIKQAMVDGAEQGMKNLDKAKRLTKDVIAEGEEKIRMVASETDRRVHKDPWPYLAGTAAFSILLGIFIGSRRK